MVVAADRMDARESHVEIEVLSYREVRCESPDLLQEGTAVKHRPRDTQRVVHAEHPGIWIIVTQTSPRCGATVPSGAGVVEETHVTVRERAVGMRLETGGRRFE